MELAALIPAFSDTLEMRVANHLHASRDGASFDEIVAKINGGANKGHNADRIMGILGAMRANVAWIRPNRQINR